ncbi:hypothetical protein GCM10009736_71170 [Actinomadura bangladeshensis]
MSPTCGGTEHEPKKLALLGLLLLGEVYEAAQTLAAQVGLFEHVQRQVGSRPDLEEIDLL